MSTYLEVRINGKLESIAFEGERLTVGRGAGNDLVLADEAVSRLHAVFDRVGSNWCVRDLSSSNGTFVNGIRITNERPVESGDEILVGDTRLVVRGAASPEGRTAAEVRAPVPELTRRERDVLEALCRPLLSKELLPEAATTKEIAAALFVTEAAVRQHLLHLYDKFGIYGDESRRRIQLAREALLRGAITPDAGP